MKRRIFSAHASSTIIEDIVLLRLKVPRNQRWILKEFRASALGWTNSEAYVRASGIIRGRQSTETPETPVTLSTPVESGEDVTLEFSNFAQVAATCAIHLMVDIYE